MSAIFSIAKRDILAQLYSPKAWVIYFFFLFFIGIFFNNFVHMLIQINQQSQQYGQPGGSTGIEDLLRAVFHNVQFILLLIIPAVSMGSFAEDKRNQSFRLLQTAPLTSWQIVLGKFLAICGVMTIALLLSAVFPLFTMINGSPDIPVVLTSYLGLFFLMISQLAFGMWVSSLTENQFIAFLFSMFGLFLMLILSFISESLGGADWVGSTIKYLASSSHLESFLKGLLSVKDVVYFVLFTFFFVFMSAVAIDSQRWR